MFFKLGWTQAQKTWEVFNGKDLCSNAHTKISSLCLTGNLKDQLDWETECDEFVKKSDDRYQFGSEQTWLGISVKQPVIDKALSGNVSSSADLPVDKDAAWDWDWSIPKLPARHGSDSGTWFCEAKKKKPTVLLGYIVIVLFASQVSTVPRYWSLRLSSKF